MRSFPSRAQLHRWLTDSLRGLPYPDHCRVLEEMFPGWTAEQLFQPAVPELLYASGRSSGLLRRDPGTTGPPVFAAPSVGLRPFIKQAFTREHVTIDFAGFSAKPSTAQSRNPSTRSHRPEQARHPGDTAAAADTSRPMVLPCRVNDLSDDPDYRARMHRLASRHAHAILDTVQELVSLGLIEHADAQIRAHPCPPLFKLYILNGEEVFFGFYPIIKHHIPLPSGPRDIYDLMGKDAVVFHHSAHSAHPADAPYVEQARACSVPCGTTSATSSPHDESDPTGRRPRHDRFPDPPPAPGLRRAHLLHLRGPARRHRRRPAPQALRRPRPAAR
jgi:hypothetical protein